MLKHSLLFRFGIVICILFFISVSGALSSAIVAETAAGYATAINHAGTLRMQSYRITSSLAQDADDEYESSLDRTATLIEEFNQRLYSPRIQNILSKGPNQRVIDSYRLVEQQWKETMLPTLQNYLSDRQAASHSLVDSQRITRFRKKLLLLVDDFMEDIHRFVKALEIDAERKNEQLRIIQIILISLGLMLAIVTLLLIKHYILKPLRDLLICANAARHGDFSVRSHFHREDELGQLGQAFNVMAKDLSVIYADLEARVRDKTQSLERSNRTLELLYVTTKRLSNSNLCPVVLEAVIHDIEALMGVDNGTICLGKPGDVQAFRYASTGKQDFVAAQRPGSPCALCLGRGETHTFQVAQGENGGAISIFSTPIRDNNQQHGVLLVEFAANRRLESWQERLLETVASHIALALNVAQQASENRRLSLLEERSVIARELHDSIAQSLSYLKIQVSRLEMTVTQDAEKKQLLHLTVILRSALNVAYRQLRELLTTFRLGFNEKNLGEAVQTTVDDFAKRSGVRIDYTNKTGNCQFAPNAEIHVIHIIREALSNIIRHAGATRAWVKLHCESDGVVSVVVEDNGIGMIYPNDMMPHYGLAIMKERTEWLGGSIMIAKSSSGGTRIELIFNIHETLRDKSRNTLIEQPNHA
ncbi:MAG: ATP-binding protein [Candidatus Promineifilaceae bacterium]